MTSKQILTQQLLAFFFGFFCSYIHFTRSTTVDDKGGSTIRHSQSFGYLPPPDRSLPVIPDQIVVIKFVTLDQQHRIILNEEKRRGIVRPSWSILSLLVAPESKRSLNRCRIEWEDYWHIQLAGAVSHSVESDLVALDLKCEVSSGSNSLKSSLHCSRSGSVGSMKTMWLSRILRWKSIWIEWKTINVIVRVIFGNLTP